MSMVKWEDEIIFTPEKIVFIYGEVGDGDNGAIDETYGLEVVVDEYNEVNGVQFGINSFGFGYEGWSRDVWENWGGYVIMKAHQFPKTAEGFEQFFEWACSIDCLYTRDENHLKDLDVIKELLAEWDK